MLTFEKCEKILNSKGRNYSKGEIEEIRNFLWSFARIELGIIEKTEGYEDSGFNEQSKQ